MARNPFGPSRARVMTDETRNIVLGHLRAIAEEPNDIAVDIAEFRQRIGRLEGDPS